MAFLDIFGMNEEDNPGLKKFRDTMALLNANLQPVLSGTSGDIGLRLRETKKREKAQADSVKKLAQALFGQSSSTPAPPSIDTKFEDIATAFDRPVNPAAISRDNKIQRLAAAIQSNDILPDISLPILTGMMDDAFSTPQRNLRTVGNEVFEFDSVPGSKGVSVAGSPRQPGAPTTRERKVGDIIITEQWNGDKQDWEEVSRAPRSTASDKTTTGDMRVQLLQKIQRGDELTAEEEKVKKLLFSSDILEELLMQVMGGGSSAPDLSAETGTRRLPHRPKDDKEYEAIPDGDWYMDPDTGQLAQKKAR